MPKFKKYKGEGDPKHHVCESYVLCQEVTYNDIYLTRLFPKHVTEEAIAWFSSLFEDSITSFSNLVEKFVAHYAYNIENDASMMDLCNMK